MAARLGKDVRAIRRRRTPRSPRSDAQMSSLTPNAASAPKPSLRTKPRPFGTGTPRARGPSARQPRSAPRSRDSLGLYVHIPFCASRCPYCDFATAPARSALRSRYLDALDMEIRRQGERLGRPRVATLYVGGGTPSLLEPPEVARLGTSLHQSFDLRPAEATVEANPATLDRARLESWAAMGITRLSLGAQSMSAPGQRARRGGGAFGRVRREPRPDFRLAGPDGGGVA